MADLICKYNEGGACTRFPDQKMHHADAMPEGGYVLKAGTIKNASEVGEGCRCNLAELVEVD